MALTNNHTIHGNVSIVNAYWVIQSVSIQKEMKDSVNMVQKLDPDGKALFHTDGQPHLEEVVDRIAGFQIHYSSVCYKDQATRHATPEQTLPGGISGSFWKESVNENVFDDAYREMKKILPTAVDVFENSEVPEV